MGRKTTGPAIARNQVGSELAKKRLELILATLSGERTVAEASYELGINEAMFFKMRTRYLAESVALLEPRKAGRKPKEASPEETTIAAQEREIGDLKLALEGQRIQTELALVAPHLLRDSAKKKPGRSGKKSGVPKKGPTKHLFRQSRKSVGQNDTSKNSGS